MRLRSLRTASGLRFIRFLDRAIKKVGVRGGVALRVCDVQDAVASLTWDTSGILFAGVGSAGIVRCNASGGAPEQLVKAEEGHQMSGPSLLPGGDALMFSVANLADGSALWDKAQIVVQSLRTGSRKTILTGGSDARFVDSGHLLYTVAGILFAVPFDPATQSVRGAAVPVIDGIRQSNGVAQLAISDTGVLAYVPGPIGARSAVSLGMAGRSGAITRLPVPEGPYDHVRVSRNGTAAVGSDDGKQAIVWIYRLTGSTALQRLTVEGNNRFPIWSPDGASVAFQSDRGGAPGIYRQRVDGTGGVERLTTAAADETHIPESWSPDGRVISYAVLKSSRYSLWTLTLATKRGEAFGGVQSLNPIGSVFSPDGRWIAYAAAPTEDVRSSDGGVFVRPFPASSGVYQAPRQIVDFHPVWTPDGSELLFVASASAGQMAAMRVSASGGITFGPPTQFPTSLNGDRLSVQTRAFDIMPDGRLIGVFNATDDRSGNSRTEIRVVLNGFEELKQRAPAK